MSSQLASGDVPCPAKRINKCNRQRLVAEFDKLVAELNTLIACTNETMALFHSKGIDTRSLGEILVLLQHRFLNRIERCPRRLKNVENRSNVVQNLQWTKDFQARLMDSLALLLKSHGAGPLEMFRPADVPVDALRVGNLASELKAQLDKAIYASVEVFIEHLKVCENKMEGFQKNYEGFIKVLISEDALQTYGVSETRLAWFRHNCLQDKNGAETQKNVAEFKRLIERVRNMTIAYRRLRECNHSVIELTMSSSRDILNALGGDEQALEEQLMRWKSNGLRRERDILAVLIGNVYLMTSALASGQTFSLDDMCCDDEATVPMMPEHGLLVPSL